MIIKLKVNRQENADFFGVDIGEIVDIDFQDYLVGVVASEISNANPAACQAQAVAARTYAVSRNMLIGQPGSDSNNSLAYRAIRFDKKKYPNAYYGVTSTTGQILVYNGQPIRAVYSANNGGQTVSSEERWHNTYPYLISQPDPWDTADGNEKKGHGVGLSQRGAIWAGAHGIDYTQILTFYYPNTQLVQNYGQEVHSMNVILNDKARKVVELAKEQLGSPYVYAAAGDLCTPNFRRKKQSNQHPNIVNKCQVLNNSYITCENCKYQNKRCFDCRGFTYWLLKQVGVNISAVGATTQYNTENSWLLRGPIKDIPNVVCAVFKYVPETKKMKHTGMHVGNGVIIHCTDVKTGEVQYDAVSNTAWTHFAVPKNLYTQEQIQRAEKVSFITGLKKGQTGLNVQELQQKLNELGYNCSVDGRYGDETSNAVKAFQKEYNLTVDGVAGAITRTLILNLTQYTPVINTLEAEIPTPANDDELIELNISRPMAEAIYQLLQKILNK